MSEQNTFEKIYEVVKQIPKGKVATYGQVAALAGNRRWARVVGYALHAIPMSRKFPAIVSLPRTDVCRRRLHLEVRTARWSCW